MTPSRLTSFSSVSSILAGLALSPACGGDANPLDSGSGGLVACPVMALSGDTLSWSAPELGTAYEQEVTVTNDCDEGDALELKLIYRGDPQITHNPKSMTLAAGESHTLRVSAYAEATGTYAGAITITSNDPEAPEAVIALTVDAGMDADADGYGYENDCNDNDASINPGSPELDDGIDQDCDGVRDEDFVSAGDLVITEMLVESTLIDDFYGEWIELLNLSERGIDLQGWTLEGSDGNEVVITDSYVVEPGDVVVIGPSDDTAANGGVSVDITYSYGGFWLLKGTDDITLMASDTEVFSLAWNTTWKIASDASISLDPDHIDASEWGDRTFWCAASSGYGSIGLLGTPGAPNDDCSSLDEDGDGFSPDDGDCNDDDASISPKKTDVWDGVDNDCNGAVDDITTDDLDDGVWSSRTYYDWLGRGGTAIADFDGDGNNDVAVGTSYATSYRGVVYILSNDQVWDGGTITGADTTITGSSNYAYFGNLAPVMGDQTGDGQVDLVVGGRDYYYYLGAAVAMFEGGSDLTGSLRTDSDATWTATSVGTNYAVQVEAALDVNGDGLDDIVAAYADADYASLADSGVVRYFDGAGLSGNVDLDESDAVVAGANRVDFLGAGLGGGDIDGDGYDDVLAGAIGSDEAGTNSGAWYIIPGSIDMVDDADVATAASAVIAHEGDQEFFGGPARPVITDLDGDGTDEVVLGGYQTDSIYVFSNDGSLGGALVTGDAIATVSGDVGFGFGMAGGDFNEDGTDDLLVGEVGSWSYFYISSVYDYLSDSGEVFWFDGATVGGGGEFTDTNAAASITGASSGGVFGAAIATGDLDGDSKPEFAATAPKTGSYNGSIFVIAVP